MELKLGKQSPEKLNKTCTQRKISKELAKIYNEKNPLKSEKVNSLTQKKEATSKFNKTNKILDLMQN